MTQTKETKETLKGITLKGITIGFICVVLISILSAFSYILLDYTYPDLAYADNGNDNYFPYVFHTALWAVTPVVLIIYVINMAKHVLSREDVTVIVMMCLLAGLQDANTQWSINPWSFFTMAPPALAYPPVYSVDQINLFKQYLSPVLFNNWDYYATVAGNSVSVNWGIVLPNTIFVVVFFGCIYTMIIFWLLLFRRTFVDVEQLSFPLSIVTMNLVEFTQPKTSRKPLWSSKMFLIGLAISFIYVFGTGVSYAYPAYDTMFNIGQSRPGWGYFVSGTTAINIGPDRPLSNFLLPLGLWTVVTFSIRDFYVGWCSLLSIDVLLSIIVGFVLFYLVFPSFYAGIWGAGEGRAMTAWQRLTGQPTQFGLESFVEGVSVNLFAVGLGLFLGIILWVIFINRETFAMAFKGLLKEPATEADPNRPLPYRTTWLIFLITLVASIGLSMVISIDPLVFTVFIILLLIFMIGHSQHYGESGAYFGSEFSDTGMDPTLWIPVLLIAIFGVQYLIGPGGAQYYSTVKIMTLVMIGSVFTRTFLAQSTMLASVTWDNAKITKTFNMDLKSMIFKVLIPATVLAGAVQTITRQILIHWLPWGKFTVQSWQIFQSLLAYPDSFTNIQQGSLPVGWLGANGFVQGGYVYQQIQAYPLDYSWKIAFGLILAIAVYVLQRRYGWFRLSVPGLLLGLTESWLLVVPAIFALIIRFLVVRLYGADTFENKVTPLMTGLIVGAIFAWFILMPLHDIFFILAEEMKRVPW